MFFTISHVFFFGVPKRLPEVVNFLSEMQEKFPSSALEKAQEFSGYMEELQQRNLEKARRLLERTESENGAEQEE